MTSYDITLTGREPVPISRRHVAALHALFFLLAIISTASLRAPVWLLGALVYCCSHRTAFLGQRLFPVRLWRAQFLFLVTSTVCSIIANTLSTLQRSRTGVRVVLWGTLYPLWALLGVQQWDARDYINTIVCPGATTVVLGAYLLILMRVLDCRVLSRNEGARLGQSGLMPPRWAGGVLTVSRIGAGSLLSLCGWATAWAAKPSAVGFSIEGFTFVFVAAFFYAEHLARQPRHSAVRSGQWLNRQISHVFGTAVAMALVFVCAAQNSGFFLFTNAHSDWCRLLGIGPVAWDSIEGLRYVLQMAGMTGVFLGATAIHGGVASPGSGPGESSTGAEVAADGEASGLLAEWDQRLLRASVPDASLTSMSAREGVLSNRHRRSLQVVAIVCITALLAYAVHYPSLVSMVIWLIHLCGCAGGLVQRPMAPSSGLRVAFVGVLTLLCGAILLQYICQALVSDSRTAAWGQWAPARPAFPDDSRAVVAQVAAEHLIALLLGVYVCTTGIDCAGSDGGSSSSADVDVDSRTTAEPQSAAIRTEICADAEGSPTADSVQVTWLRAQLHNAAADRKKLHELFEVSMGRSPLAVELDALLAAVVQERGSYSPVASRGGLTVEEMTQFLACGPLYTYAIILCMFVLGTSGAAMDFMHATCLVLSLGVSVIGCNAVLYRGVRTVPPVWVVLLVGVQLCYRVFAVGGKQELKPELQQQQQQQRIFAPTQPPLIKRALHDYVAFITPIAWEDCTTYIYTQIVLLWCSRYTPRCLTDWTPVSQCLVFRCRWAHFFHTVHQVASVAVLAWIALLLPRSASVTLLILLLVVPALLQHLRWLGLAYVWHRYLVVGYCGVVLMGMLTAEFGPVQPQIRKLLHILGCPSGAEGRCAQDIGLPAGSAKWLTPLSIPWWLVIVLTTASAGLYPLPSSLISSPDATPATGASNSSTSLRRRALTWGLWLLSRMLYLVLLTGIVYTALQRPSLLTALYLVGPGLGVFPCWTFGVTTVHVALQCAYQLWFSPAWLDAQTRFGVSLAKLIGLWKYSSDMDVDTDLPSTLSVAAAPLLIAALQFLQLQCALLARWKAGDTVATASTRARAWCRLQRMCATHLYLLLLLVLLFLTQTIALGWGVGALIMAVWVSAEVRDCGVLQRRRWLFRAFKAATATLMALAFVLHWLHTVFPFLSALSLYPWFFGGAIDGEKTGAGLMGVCWVAAAACVVLRVSSGAPRDGESEQLLCHSHGLSLIDSLRHRSGWPREHHERLSALLSRMSSDEAHVFFSEIADTLRCDEVPADESDGLLAASSRAPPSKSGLFVIVARLVPLVACGSVAVGSKTLPPCALSVALLFAGLGLAVKHARLHWCFWRWWRLAVVLYALLPLFALVAACPYVRDVIPKLPLWVGLLIGLSPDVSHVDGNALVFSLRHVLLFLFIWLQSCVYNCPEFGEALLRDQDEERRLGEARHAVLQKQLLLHLERATQEAVRVDKEIRAYLNALRAGNDMADASHVLPERNAECMREDNCCEADGDRFSVSSHPPMMPGVIQDEEGRVLNFGGTLPGPPLTSPGPEGRSDAAPRSALSTDQPQPSSFLRWRQLCVGWLRRLCITLAAYTYHPSESRLSCAAAAAADSSPSTIYFLTQHALLTAVQIVLRHTALALFVCTLVNALLTGCLWELTGLCCVIQVALAYYPSAPRVVYQGFGVYLTAGVVLKAAVMMWTSFECTDSSIIRALSWTVLPLREHGCRSANSNPVKASRSSCCTLRYDTIWMDLVTMGVLLLHDRICIIHGVYVEHEQQSRDNDNTDMAVLHTSSASFGEGARLPTTVKASMTPSPAPAAPRFPSPLLQRTSNHSSLCSLVVDYYNNLLIVPGVGEDWYIFYTSVDILALLVSAVFYSRMAGNDSTTLQDNVYNNLLPGPMALLICVNVLQLVLDRMMYVLRCMRLKVLANAVCTISYALLYWWWRNAVAVSARVFGNTYFILKVVALVLSVMQVRGGFPVYRRGDSFTTHPGSLVSYSCFKVYRALPFLWEVCTLVDWSVLRTSLSLEEYLTVEDVSVYIYQCRERYLAKRRDREELGDAVAPYRKWAFGVSYLALVLLALLGPLLYYSTYNPSTVANRATHLNLQLSFFGAYDFFATTVHENVTTPEGWWAWIERTRPTLASYGLMAERKNLQLMEFTSCSSNMWMVNPQALRHVLDGLRAAVLNKSSAHVLQTLEVSRSVSDAASATTVSQVNNWLIPWDTAQDLVAILSHEIDNTTATAAVNAQSGSTIVGTASLPFFYSPFLFNRASQLNGLPLNPHFPHRNQHNCTLELNHERDVALNSLVRYWCLHCEPLFPEGNIPSENISSAAEWRCLTRGEGCSDFNYEDVSNKSGNHVAQVPMYIVVVSDTVVIGISFLKGIGIVAIYTTLVLAFGRLLRSILANQVSTLLYSNMANPTVLENMVRCIGMARAYGDLRLEHTIYIELVDLLRSAERLSSVTGSLRCLYTDAGHEDLFQLGHVRRRDSRRNPSQGAHEGVAGEGHDTTGVPSAVSQPMRAS
ncbi:hypothetical protein JKF63_00340 [Porcisia hertigi]|uniref:Piezo non-specific cation channel R-Ras-binding domain-containing protein n=1 Tax=Porcisia hertigi TaxID=2761500 RepID=A0A836KWZ8_9TRYP|nr:hypothetical protein JKF63_00340 [Porcisia hertigi]